MKKRCKTLVLSLAAAALLILLPFCSSLTVRAEEPATYSLKFFSDRGWRCQPGAAFQDSEGDADLNYLNLYLKDGDLLVIYPGDKPNEELDLSNISLSNLTVHQKADVVIKAKSIRDCYILAGSSCAVNGDVTHAYLYDSTVCNFNNNVLDMILYLQADSPNASTNIGCLGTVGRFYVCSLADNSGKNVFYNVTAGGMLIQDGTFHIPDGKYSAEPTAEYTKAMEGSSSPATPAAPAPSSPATPAPAPNPSDAYDKVPKTGDDASYLWLFLAAAVFGTGSFVLHKKAN